MGDICWSGCLLHKAIRAADVGGRSRFAYVEQYAISWLSRYLVVRLRQRCAGVRARQGGWILFAGSC